MAPGHPLARDHAEYVKGVYEQERLSLVAPVTWEALTAAPAYQVFAAELEACSFRRKISAEVTERRRDRLHATISGGLTHTDLEKVTDGAARFLGQHGPLRIRVLGPFLGRKNTGRIYLPVVPELLDGEQAFGRLQAELGLKVTGFYVVGLFNLAGELDASETRELAQLVEKWQETVLLETELRRLQILGTHDDLVLSGRCLAEIA